MFVHREKQCGKCRQTLPLDSFNRLGDGRQLWCRECFRTYFRARGALHHQQVHAAKGRHRRAARAYVLDYLSSRRCSDCGEADFFVLEFDHVGAKESHVAVIIAEGQSIARIERELAHCQVVCAIHGGYRLELLQKELAECEICCANCHRRRTARRTVNYRWRSTMIPPP